jgi:SAM-dependent methyltransferase
MGFAPVIKRLIKNEIWWEYEGELYPELFRRGNACIHIEDKASQFCDGIGLDIGAGGYPFRGAFPVRDSVNFIYRNGKQVERKIPLIDGVNAYNLRCFVDGSLDYIFSSHCLEHLEKPFEALTLWKTKLKPGGVLFLYLPHPDMKLWNPGSPWVRTAHKWKPTYEILAGWFYKLGFKIISGSPVRDDFYSFHIAGQKNG